MAILIAVATIVIPRPALAGDDPLVEAAALQNQVATLFQQGRYGEIEPLLKRLVTITRITLGPTPPRLRTASGFSRIFTKLRAVTTPPNRFTAVCWRSGKQCRDRIASISAGL